MQDRQFSSKSHEQNFPGSLLFRPHYIKHTLPTLDLLTDLPLAEDLKRLLIYETAIKYIVLSSAESLKHPKPGLSIMGVKQFTTRNIPRRVRLPGSRTGTQSLTRNRFRFEFHDIGCSSDFLMVK